VSQDTAAEESFGGEVFFPRLVSISHITLSKERLQYCFEQLLINDISSAGVERSSQKGSPGKTGKVSHIMCNT
jgi:hypothetical protein